MKNLKKRLLAGLLATAMLLANMSSLAAYADEPDAPAPDSVSEPAPELPANENPPELGISGEQPAPVEQAPTAAPAPAPTAAPTPEPTAAPTPEPTPEPAPEATPEPAPTAAPEARPEPEATPEPTAAPAQDPGTRSLGAGFEEPGFDGAVLQLVFELTVDGEKQPPIPVEISAEAVGKAVELTGAAKEKVEQLEADGYVLTWYADAGHSVRLENGLADLTVTGGLNQRVYGAAEKPTAPAATPEPEATPEPPLQDGGASLSTPTAADFTISVVETSAAQAPYTEGNTITFTFTMSANKEDVDYTSITKLAFTVHNDYAFSSSDAALRAEEAKKTFGELPANNLKLKISDAYITDSTNVQTKVGVTQDSTKVMVNRADGAIKKGETLTILYFYEVGSSDVRTHHDLKDIIEIQNNGNWFDGQLVQSALGTKGKDEYRVSFAANGGSGSMADVWVGKDSSYKLPDCTFTAPAGQTFDQWEIGGNKYAAGAEVTVSSDITVTATWKTAPPPTGHTVTYHYVKDSGFEKSDPQYMGTKVDPQEIATKTVTVPAGASFTPEVPGSDKTPTLNNDKQEKNFRFVKWTDEKGDEFTGPQVLTENINLYAQWQAYTLINFIFSGITVSSTEHEGIKATQYVEGDSFTLPNAATAEPGVVFLGWRSDLTNAKGLYLTGDTATIKGTPKTWTFKAVWAKMTAQNATFTYDGALHAIDPDQVTVTYYGLEGTGSDDTKLTASPAAGGTVPSCTFEANTAGDGTIGSIPAFYGNRDTSNTYHYKVTGSVTVSASGLDQNQTKAASLSAEADLIINEAPTKTYTVQYVYDGEPGTDPDDTVTGSARVGTEIHYDNATRTHNGQNYIFERVDPATPTVTDTEPNTVTVYYSADNIGGGADLNSPDKVADKYQATLIYKANANGSVTVDGASGTEIKKVVTLGNVGAPATTGSVTLAAAANANTGYAFDRWTAESTGTDVPSITADEKELKDPVTLKGGETYTFTASFAPDTIGQDKGTAAGDGIPDKYQVTVTFKAVNGTFGDSSTEKKVVYTRYGADGKPSERGSATIETADIPTVTANAGYTARDCAWDPTVPANVSTDAEYTFTCKNDDNGDGIADETQTVTINFSVHNYAGEYDGEEHQATYTFTAQVNGGAILTDTLPAGMRFTVAQPGPLTGKDVCEKTLNLGESFSHVDSGHYKALRVNSATLTLEITPAPVTLTAEKVEVSYGDAEPAAYQVNKTGTIYNDDFTYTGKRASSDAWETLKAGTYPDEIVIEVNWKNTDLKKNYALTINNADLVIEAKSLGDGSAPDTEHGITVDPLPDVLYNGADQRQEPVITHTGAAHTGPLTLGTDYTLSYSADTVNAGTVTVTVTGTGSYSGSFTLSYRIIPRPARIEAEAAVKNEGDPDPVFSATVTGTVAGERLNYILSRQPGEAPGYYILYVTPLSNPNYEVTAVANALYIAGAARTAPAGPTAPSGPDGGNIGPDGPDGGVDITGDVTPLAPAPAQNGADGSVNITEDETPLAGGILAEDCCILHLFIMLLALAVSVYYTHDRKKHQAREFELREKFAFGE